MKSSLRSRAIATALALILTATFGAPAFASSHQPPGPYIARTGVAASDNWSILPAFTGSSLNALSMRSVTDGWIVGDSGVSFHYNGTNWVSVSTGVANNLNSVYAVPGTSEAWAVGDAGTILHFANGAWSVQASGTSQQLDSVWMVSTVDGWAVGANGMILHYTAPNWTQVQAGAFAVQFHDVQMLSATNGWAVGEGGTVIHYDGFSWQPVNSTTSIRLYGVWMTSAADGWLVGDAASSTTPSTILHWTNGGMTPYSSSPINTRLWYVNMTSANEGWASANGGYLLHYLNGTWSMGITTPLTGAPLYGVWMPVPWEGWAVGGSGVVLHYKAAAPYTVYMPYIAR